MRNVLGLQEAPRNSEATNMISHSRVLRGKKSKAGPTSPARDENVKWNRTVLGLNSRVITMQARASASREIERRETVQGEQLAKIRSILGLEALDEIASAHVSQGVNRARDALLHPAVAFASEPGLQIKRAVISPSSSSTPEPIEASAEGPQLPSSAPSPTGDMVVEAIFGQSSAPKTPKRYHDEPLPMLADGSASGSRREERRMPLLMLVSKTPIDQAEPILETLSTDAGANGDDRANEIALATPSELTAEYLDPLMPLLHALSASRTQSGVEPALTERDASTSGTSRMPVVLDAANDESADLATRYIDEQAPSPLNISYGMETPASRKSEAPPIPLFAKIELPKTPVLLSDGNFRWAMLPVVALTKSFETAHVQIAASESLAIEGLNSPSGDDVGKLVLTDESSIKELVREIPVQAASVPQSSDATIQLLDDEPVRPDDSGLATPTQQVATEIAPNEASVRAPSSGTKSSAASISRVPLLNQEEQIGARTQLMATNKRNATPLNESLAARFDIFDPKMTSPPISADTFDLFTLKDALRAWFDIFDPTMVASRVVVLPTEDRHAARSALASRSLAPERFDGTLLAVWESEALLETPASLVKAQTLPNIQFEDTKWDEARLTMLSPVEAPAIQQESDAGASADSHQFADNAGESGEQNTARVFEESTVEKAMARRSLAASTPVVSREALHKSQGSTATNEPSAVQAYSSIMNSVQDVVLSDLPRETHAPQGIDQEAAATTATDELRTNPLQGELVSLSDSKLDQMRGGFETDAGLKISFGIERAVYINGTLVTTTSLNISDLSKLSAGQAQVAGLSGASLGLIQNGPSNTFAPGQIAASSVATVIQNTLNDQKIQGITLINATVNSLDLIRRANVQSSILNALTDSLRR